MRGPSARTKSPSNFSTRKRTRYAMCSALEERRMSMWTRLSPRFRNFWVDTHARYKGRVEWCPAPYAATKRKQFLKLSKHCVRL